LRSGGAGAEGDDEEGDDEEGDDEEGASRDEDVAHADAMASTRRAHWRGESGDLARAEAVGARDPSEKPRGARERRGGANEARTKTKDRSRADPGLAIKYN
jgi:hypothetical protein